MDTHIKIGIKGEVIERESLAFGDGLDEAHETPLFGQTDTMNGHSIDSIDGFVGHIFTDNIDVTGDGGHEGGLGVVKSFSPETDLVLLSVSSMTIPIKIEIIFTHVFDSIRINTDGYRSRCLAIMTGNDDVKIVPATPFIFLSSILSRSGFDLTNSDKGRKWVSVGGFSFSNQEAISIDISIIIRSASLTIFSSGMLERPSVCRSRFSAWPMYSLK